MNKNTVKHTIDLVSTTILYYIENNTLSASLNEKDLRSPFELRAVVSSEVGQYLIHLETSSICTSDVALITMAENDQEETAGVCMD